MCKVIHGPNAMHFLKECVIKIIQHFLSRSIICVITTQVLNMKQQILREGGQNNLKHITIPIKN